MTDQLEREQYWHWFHGLSGISQKEKEVADMEIEQYFCKMKERGYDRKEALELASEKVNGGE